jgi:hypothetical protein
MSPPVVGRRAPKGMSTTAPRRPIDEPGVGDDPRVASGFRRPPDEAVGAGKGILVNEWSGLPGVARRGERRGGQARNSGGSSRPGEHRDRR